MSSVPTDCQADARGQADDGTVRQTGHREGWCHGSVWTRSKYSYCHEWNAGPHVQRHVENGHGLFQFARGQKVSRARIYTRRFHRALRSSSPSSFTCLLYADVARGPRSRGWRTALEENKRLGATRLSCCRHLHICQTFSR